MHSTHPISETNKKVIILCKNIKSLWFFEVENWSANVWLIAGGMCTAVAAATGQNLIPTYGLAFANGRFNMCVQYSSRQSAFGGDIMTRGRSVTGGVCRIQ